MCKNFGLISLALALAYSGPVAEGDAEAGDKRYHKSCHACHGPAGKGVSSYPKVSGNPIQYTREKLIAYRAGQKFGPNSGLMIMMAKKLTDEEIDNLAAYLKDAVYK
ncbi:c-type cytochrome [Alphaproteobacteria bacterium]|nr:c-type cytochrome [Alphaproteobacteria bacterium]